MIRSLPPGSYTVTVAVSGFQKSVTQHVVTEVDKISTVNITLAVGTSTQVVTVQTTPSVMLNTESGTVGQLVTAKQISTLPLNGRSWIELMSLTPGAVGFHGTTSNQDVLAAVTPQGVVVNGLRGGNNAYYLDGSPMSQRQTQTFWLFLPLTRSASFEYRQEITRLNILEAEAARSALPRNPAQTLFMVMFGNSFETMCSTHALFSMRVSHL